MKETTAGGKTPRRRAGGLGRGLSTLIEPKAASTSDTVSRTDPSNPAAREVPIDLVFANKDQPRKVFAEEDLEELASSIRTAGVLQPILVRPLPDKPGSFSLVAGERRWRAAQRAGLTHIPAVVRELDEPEVTQLALIENLHRSDLNPVEEARGYKRLIEETGKGQQALAELVGKSRVHVTNTLRLLKLPESVLRRLERGELTAGHGRLLVGCKDAARLATEIVRKGLSVRGAEALIDHAGQKKRRKGKRARTETDADTAEMEQSLSAAIGRAVRISDRGGKGEVRIAYLSYEDLDSLSGSLTGLSLSPKAAR